jgi:hypothetical protein
MAPVLDEVLAHWSRWPRVPQLELEGLGMIAGSDSVMACTGDDACSQDAARQANARYVLFTRVEEHGFFAALYDATDRKLLARSTEAGVPDASMVERVVARTLAPERALGTLRVEGAQSADIDGTRMALPASLGAGVHHVVVAGGEPRDVVIPLRGEVVVVPQAAAPRARFPGPVMMALGGAGVAVAVLMAALGVGLAGVALERHWTASQAARLQGSAVTQRWVLYQAAWLERGAVTLGALALLAGVVGLGLLGGGLSWWLWGA